MQHTRQPGPQTLHFLQFIQARIKPDREVLHQILGIVLVTAQSAGKAVQVIEIGPEQRIETPGVCVEQIQDIVSHARAVCMRDTGNECSTACASEKPEDAPVLFVLMKQFDH
jgi:hypothetical protein